MEAGARAGGPSAVPASFAQAARVRGTVVDAATGERLSGARLKAADVEGQSGADGRFELALAVGWSGDLHAETEDGRRARIPLLTVRAEGLEVVLRVTRP